jgi:hypothetical protein
VHRADDEERRAEQHALVVEHARHTSAATNIDDQGDEQRGADDTLLGVDVVHQPGVGRPRPPESGHTSAPRPNPGGRRVVGEQRRDLREREQGRAPAA